MGIKDVQFRGRTLNPKTLTPQTLRPFKACVTTSPNKPERFLEHLPSNPEP